MTSGPWLSQRTTPKHRSHRYAPESRQAYLNGRIGELKIGTEGCGEEDEVVVIHPNCKTGWAGMYFLYDALS